MVIKLSTTFRCTPEQLFPYLEEPEKMKLWMTGLVDIQPTSDGPTRVGSTSKHTMKEGRGTREYDCAVTAYDKPRRIEVVVTGGSLKTHTQVFADYRLEREGASTTRVDYECRFESKKLLFKLMGSLFGWLGKVQVKRFFANLRRLVEAPA